MLRYICSENRPRQQQYIMSLTGLTAQILNSEMVPAMGRNILQGVNIRLYVFAFSDEIKYRDKEEY